MRNDNKPFGVEGVTWRDQPNNRRPWHRSQGRYYVILICVVLLELKHARCACCSTPLGSRTYYLTFIIRGPGEDSESPRIVARRCVPCWLSQQLPSERCAPVTVTYRIVHDPQDVLVG